MKFFFSRMVVVTLAMSLIQQFASVEVQAQEVVCPQTINLDFPINDCYGQMSVMGSAGAPGSTVWYINGEEYSTGSPSIAWYQFLPNTEIEVTALYSSPMICPEGIAIDTTFVSEDCALGPDCLIDLAVQQIACDTFILQTTNVPDSLMPLTWWWDSGGGLLTDDTLGMMTIVVPEGECEEVYVMYEHPLCFIPNPWGFGGYGTESVCDTCAVQDCPDALVVTDLGDCWYELELAGADSLTGQITWSLDGAPLDLTESAYLIELPTDSVFTVSAWYENGTLCEGVMLEAEVVTDGCAEEEECDMWMEWVAVDTCSVTAEITGPDWDSTFVVSWFVGEDVLQIGATVTFDFLEWATEDTCLVLWAAASGPSCINALVMEELVCLGGCVDGVDGVEERLDHRDIRAFPVPARDRLVVKGLTGLVGRWLLTDLGGRVQVEGTFWDRLAVDVSGLPAGVYGLQLLADGERPLSLPIVVKR